MRHNEQRERLRAVLAGTECVSPATVFDALSARVAEATGHKVGILAGSVTANTLLTAPDLALHTLTEFADQVRRIMRACHLSLIVDADNGFGNALNVMRTVQELEHAGVAGILIEDTVLPARFGAAEDASELVSIDEMTGKLRAAVAARSDPALVIAGRTAGLKAEDTERTVARAQAYTATGIDAIFITGLEKIADYDAVRAAVTLPIIVGRAPDISRDVLAARGARLVLQGHQPVAAMVKALRETYTHLVNGGNPAELKSKIASADEMERLLNGAGYRQWQREYLR